MCQERDEARASSYRLRRVGPWSIRHRSFDTIRHNTVRESERCQLAPLVSIVSYFFKLISISTESGLAVGGWVSAPSRLRSLVTGAGFITSTELSDFILRSPSMTRLTLLLNKRYPVSGNFAGITSSTRHVTLGT